MIVRVGTRGSALALAQTVQVTSLLARMGLTCEVVPIRTLGDRHPDRPAASLGVGAFVKDLEAALLEGRIDLAVHSAKDLPGGTSCDLVLAAFLPRQDPRDALVTRDGRGLAALPPGALVGTDSPRRRAFLLAARPDLGVRGIRGNVDTRLRKLSAGEVDALVLAAAGLARLGQAGRVAEVLDPAVMLPAVGQGAVVVQTRADAAALREHLAAVDHAPTRAAVAAERAFLAALGGGCQRPIAALATVSGPRLRLEGAVLDRDGTAMVRDTLEGPASHPAEVGVDLAARLRATGAQRLLAEVAP
ncbi:MAG: hydroxymethylbilane synthase [Armatimonadota bacterium]|nr:hydroxymethylbilane synthase [Armatimonadota bacterium]